MSAAVAADPGPPVAEVWNVVEAVWESLLEAWPSPAEPLAVEADWLTAVVSVDGDWSGAVALSCPPRTALHMSRTMLDLAWDDPEPEPDDIADAVREVVNVLGGNVKALVAGARALGPPVLAVGRPNLEGNLVAELHVGWPGHAARVGVWRGHPRPLTHTNTPAAPPAGRSAHSQN